MIKYEIKNKSQLLSATGSLKEITTESLLLIRKIYVQFRKQDPMLATFYRTLIERAVTEPESPLFDKDDHVSEGETVISYFNVERADE